MLNAVVLLEFPHFQIAVSVPPFMGGGGMSGRPSPHQHSGGGRAWRLGKLYSASGLHKSTKGSGDSFTVF